MHDFFVIWKTDEDEYFITKLTFVSMDIANSLSMQDFVEIAFDAEYPDIENEIAKGVTYSCLTIFTSIDTNFIY